MTSRTSLILVTGATGQQGGAVAAALLRKEQRVRVLTRSPSKASALSKAGAEVVKGDLTNEADLQAALRGVDGVFAMSTPFEGGMEAEVRQGIVMADAAKQAGVTHYVFTSVASANHNTGIPHFESKWKIERHIRHIGLRATVLRPAGFMENFKTFYAPSKEGELWVPLRPTTKLQMVAVKDIGEFGAAAFLDPDRFSGLDIDLAGDALTMPEAAALWSRVSGREIQFRQIPDDQVTKLMGDDMARMFRWLNEVGYSIDIRALERRFQIPPTKFADLIATEGWAS